MDAASIVIIGCQSMPRELVVKNGRLETTKGNDDLDPRDTGSEIDELHGKIV